MVIVVAKLTRDHQRMQSNGSKLPRHIQGYVVNV